MGGSCEVCGGDPNQVCCDGTCCDPDQCEDCNSVTGQCEVTCDSDNCMECDGQGNCVVTCEDWQCCIDGECVDPICENCHSASGTLFECGHYPSDTDCATDWCIKNVLDSATCDRKDPGWPCSKSRCNTTIVSPHEDEITQYKIDSGSCPGGTVNYVPWKTLHYGCDSCSSFIWEKSCETTSCSGQVEYSVGRGNKKQCGGCGY